MGKRGKNLTERLDTSVEPDLARWVRRQAEREERKPAAIVRRALRVYREQQEAALERVREDVTAA